MKANLLDRAFNVLSRRKRVFFDHAKRVYVTLYRIPEQGPQVDILVRDKSIPRLTLGEAEMVMQCLAEALMVAGHDPTVERA